MSDHTPTLATALTSADIESYNLETLDGVNAYIEEHLLELSRDELRARLVPLVRREVKAIKDARSSNDAGLAKEKLSQLESTAGIAEAKVLGLSASFRAIIEARSAQQAVQERMEALPGGNGHEDPHSAMDLDVADAIAQYAGRHLAIPQPPEPTPSLENETDTLDPSSVATERTPTPGMSTTSDGVERFVMAAGGAPLTKEGIKTRLLPWMAETVDALVDDVTAAEPVFRVTMSYN